MSERSIELWTCDRCGVVEERGCGAQPSLWRRVRFYTPPRSSEYEVGKTFDLCLTCTRVVTEFLGVSRNREAETVDRASHPAVDGNCTPTSAGTALAAPSASTGAEGERGTGDTP